MPIQIPVTQTGLEASIQRAMSIAGKNAKIDLGTSSKAIDSLSQPLGRITGQADQFGKSMEAANARVLAFGASVGILGAVTRGFKEMIGVTIQVEKSLADINSVLGANATQLNKFKNDIFNVARETGNSFQTVSEAALELSRQGLKSDEVLRRLKDSMILSRLSGLDAASAVEGLTAAVNSFSKEGVTTSDVLNRISKTAAKFSVSERDLIEGFKRSASVAQQAGVSLDELGGIITAVQERTARGGAVIGNAFKTIFTRIQRPESLAALQDIGAAVTDTQGKILPATKLIENLAQRINGLNDIQVANITEKIGGGFQVGPLIAALDDITSKTSTFKAATEAMGTAGNEAYLRNAVLNKTLAASINEATVNLQELANTLGEIGVTDSLKNILSFFNSLTTNIKDLLQGEGIGSDFAKGIVKGISAVVSGPGLIVFAAIVTKLTYGLIKFGTESLKAFFGIGQAQKEINALASSLTNTLMNNQNIHKAVLSLEGNHVAQATLLGNILKQNNAEMQKFVAMGARLAPGVASVVKGGGKNAAGGYMPAVSKESSDIQRGVGGARASDKPVVLPNFAFGGGKKGTMVANSGEYLVPNFGGSGGSAIFNRDMIGRMGLPSNAQKINSAGGFVPNFAKIKEPIAEVAEVQKYADDLEAYRIYRDGSASKTFRFPSGGIRSEAQVQQALSSNKSKSLPSTLNIDANALGGLGVVSVSGGVGNVQTSEETKAMSASEQDFLNDNFGKNKIQKVIMSNVQSKSLANLDSSLRKDNQESFRSKVKERFSGPLVDLGNELIGRTFIGNHRADYISKLSSQENDPALFSDSVLGGIFESAIRVATKQVGQIGAFNDTDSDAPFDFEEGGEATTEFKNAFKFEENLFKADAKKTANSKTIKTIIGKSLRDQEVGRRIRKNYASQVSSQVSSQIAIKSGASGYIPNFANYIYDSDKLTPELRASILPAILSSKKRKNGIIGPAGSGKSTMAGGIGQFIQSMEDVAKATGFTILSGAALAKTPTGISKQFQPILDSIKRSGGSLKYLNVDDAEIKRRRDKRIAIGSNDLRSEAQLKGSSYSPLNQPEFLDALKREMGGSLQIINGASGYVPNFANPLKEAISREIGAGVSPSQVYVDQSNSLKGPMNPSGLMVANRRDEPQGGFQGINRARKEGANAKTYGAAGGFVPNFAQKTPVQTTAEQNTAKSMSDTVGKLIILQTVTTGLSGVFGEMGGEVAKFGDGISTLATTIMSMSMLSSTSASSGKMGIGASISKGYFIAKDNADTLKSSIEAGGSGDPRAIRELGIRTSDELKNSGADKIAGKLGVMAASSPSIVAGVGKISGLASGIGSAFGLVGKFLPVVGQLIFAFQGLSAIAKMFGVDVDGAMKKFGQYIGFLDSPAKEAANKLRELGKVDISNISEGNFEGKGKSGLSVFLQDRMIKQQSENAKIKSKDDSGSIKDSATLKKEVLGKEFEYESFRRNKDLYARLAGLKPKELQTQYNKGGDTQFQKESITAADAMYKYKGATNLQAQTISNFEMSLAEKYSSKEAQQNFKLGADAGLSPNQMRAQIGELISSGEKNVGTEKVTKIKNLLAGAGDFTNPEKIKEILGELSALDKQRNIEVAKLNYQEKINLELAQLRLESAIKLKMALFDLPTAQDSSLAIEKELLSTTDARKISIEKEIEARSRSKELIKSQVESVKGLVINSKDLMDSLDKDLNNDILVENWDKVKNIVGEYADTLMRTGDVTKAEEEMKKSILSIYGATEGAAKSLQDIVSATTKVSRDLFDIETKKLDINRKINSIAEAQNYIISLQNAQKQESLDIGLKEIANAEKLNSVNDRMFKARAEGLKSITSKDVGDRIDTLTNNRERATAISSSANEQKKIFAELQKDLIKTVTDKKLPDYLSGKITAAKDIQGLQSVAQEMAEVEKKAAIDKLDAAFKTAEIALKTSYDARDITVEGARTAAQAFLDAVSSYGTLSPRSPIDRGAALPRAALDDLRSKYHQQRENLSNTSLNNNEYANKIKEAQDALINASNDLSARLAELDPAYKNAKKALEDNFTKSLLTFENNLSKREMNNINLQTKKQIGSARLESKINNPETYTGIYTQEGYLAKQHDLEMQKLRQEQDFQSKIDANTAAIELERKLYTLDNITAIKDNSKVIRDLIDQFQQNPESQGVAAGGPSTYDDLLKKSIKDNHLLSKFNNAEENKKILGGDGAATEENVLGFLKRLMQKESSGNPTASGDAGKFNGGSHGLFQLSKKDRQNYGIGGEMSMAELQNPATNIDVAGKIISRRLGNTGNITGEDGVGAYFGPVARGELNFSEMNPETSNQFADLGDMVPKIQQAVADIQKMNVEYSKIPEIAMKAAGNMNLQGDAQNRVAGEIAKTVQQSSLRNEQDKKAIELAEERYQISLAENQARSFGSGLSEGMRKLNLETSNFKYDLGTKIPSLFADNMASAMEGVIMQGEGLKDSLRSAATNFLNEITKANIKNLAGQFTGGIGNIGTLFRANGGPITGGSGNKDDVPAMLMGGEYVMNKRAVSKYGSGFMEALNNGSISGYAKGGSVIRGRGLGSDTVSNSDSLTQTGDGGFQMPGYYGAGTISGKKDLLNYATQSYTSGAGDIIGGGKDSSYIDLTPESVRLTNFGRRQGPMADAVRESKKEAFGLYTQQLAAEKQAKEEEKAQKKAFKKAIINSLITSAISAGVGAGAAGFKAGVLGAGPKAGLLDKLGAGAKGIFSGGDIGGGVMAGGLKNLFTGNYQLSQISDLKGYQQYLSGNPKEIEKLLGGASSRSITGPSGQTLSAWSNIDSASSALKYIPKRATGGAIPQTSGIDTVPAMLSGGEFIMNAGATQRIGANNLNALNSGASTETNSSAINDQLINKIDELIRVTKESSKPVTVNVSSQQGQNGQEGQQDGGSQKDQNLSKRIRDAVVQVLQEEKRLGGVLRRS